MLNRFFLPFAALVSLTTQVGIAVAEQPQARHPCASIADNAARLACYDRTFGPPAGASTNAPVAAAAPASAAVDPAVKAREEFGLSEAEKRMRSPSQNAPPAPEKVTGTVASVTRRATGEAVIALENGEVWVELEAYAGVVVRAGDAVTIRKVALGSYLLVTPRNVATRVRRLK